MGEKGHRSLGDLEFPPSAFQNQGGATNPNGKCCLICCHGKNCDKLGAHDFQRIRRPVLQPSDFPGGGLQPAGLEGAGVQFTVKSQWLKSHQSNQSKPPTKGCLRQGISRMHQTPAKKKNASFLRPGHLLSPLPALCQRLWVPNGSKRSSKPPLWSTRVRLKTEKKRAGADRRSSSMVPTTKVPRSSSREVRTNGPAFFGVVYLRGTLTKKEAVRKGATGKSRRHCSPESAVSTASRHCARAKTTYALGASGLGDSGRIGIDPKFGRWAKQGEQL